MAFGLTPSFTENINTENIPESHLLVLALSSAEKMKLDVIYKSQSGFIAVTTNGIFKFNCRITCTITADTVNVESQSTGTEMFDMGRNKKKVREFEKIFFPMATNYNPEETHAKYEILKTELSPDKEDKIRNPDKSSFFALFVPRSGFFVTPLLVDISILIFVLMAFSGVSIFAPQKSDILAWGADFGPLTLNGQWWRIVTNFFIHIGIMHLVLNMYALVYIGILLEPFLGKLRYAAAYLLTGIAGSVCSLYIHSFTISAGASGAIFGLYGVFLAMLSTNFIEKKTRKPLLISIGIFVLMNLTNGMKSGIDNAAHIGGLVTGIIIGYAYVFTLRRPDNVNIKYIVTACLALFILTSSIFAYNRIPNDFGIYQAKMKIFLKNEFKAEHLFQKISLMGSGDSLDDAKGKITGLWLSNLNILQQNNRLNLPPVLHDKDLIFTKYYDLRMASLNLIYKDLKEKTDRYNDSIEYYNAKIKETLNSLK